MWREREQKVQMEEDEEDKESRRRVEDGRRVGGNAGGVEKEKTRGLRHDGEERKK